MTYWFAGLMLRPLRLATTCILQLGPIALMLERRSGSIICKITQYITGIPDNTTCNTVAPMFAPPNHVKKRLCVTARVPCKASPRSRCGTSARAPRLTLPTLAAVCRILPKWSHKRDSGKQVHAARKQQSKLLPGRALCNGT